VSFPIEELKNENHGRLGLIIRGGAPRHRIVWPGPQSPPALKAGGKYTIQYLSKEDRGNCLTRTSAAKVEPVKKRKD